MFTAQGDFFVLLPTTSKHRILHPGTVVECSATSVVGKLKEPLTLEPGTQVLLLAELNRKFMQQGASVHAVLDAGAEPTVGFALEGQPISAEGRSAYRVSLAASNLACTFGADKQAILLDVSPSGFAVSSSLKLNVADTVRVSLNYGGQSFGGQARVQSVRDLGGSKARYGLHAIEAGRGQKNDLQRGLGSVTAAAQRDQLRRRARA